MTMANIDSFFFFFFFFSLLCHVNSHIDMSALGQAMAWCQQAIKALCGPIWIQHFFSLFSQTGEKSC